MTEPTSRPPEIANLFNPAFLAVMAARTADGYRMESNRPLPYPLLFVALPILLHRPTRERLPRMLKTHLAAWLPTVPDARVGFAERARMLVPFVREATVFGLAHGALVLRPDGTLLPGEHVNLKRPLPQFKEHEENACLIKATFVGRWFAAAGPPSTIFTLWGVRP